MKLFGLKPKQMEEWANRNLIDWLNHAPSSSIRRVLELIDLMQAAGRIADGVRRASNKEQCRSRVRALNAILAKLNPCLLGYSCKAQMRLYGPSLDSYYLFAAGKRGTHEVRAVAFLIDNIPLVHRVRRCLECPRWFFAVTEHQKFCNDNCRKKHSAQGESFLETRRVYMRDYRRKRKEADAWAMKSIGGRK